MVVQHIHVHNRRREARYIPLDTLNRRVMVVIQEHVLKQQVQVLAQHLIRPELMGMYYIRLIIFKIRIELALLLTNRQLRILAILANKPYVDRAVRRNYHLYST